MARAISIVSTPPWVDMRRGDEGEVSLRRRIMADSETVPADSADLREMDRHHVEETCVDQETTPQDVVLLSNAQLQFRASIRHWLTDLHKRSNPVTVCWATGLLH